MTEEMERQITWLLIQNPHFVHIAVAPDFIVRFGVSTYGRPTADRPGRPRIHERPPIRLSHHGQPAGALLRPDPFGINGKDTFAIFFPVFVKDKGLRRIWGAVEWSSMPRCSTRALA
jgi:hypothetical protein